MTNERPPTYCNPIPLPDYPRGRQSRNKDRVAYGWMNRGQRRDFRETADPSVLFHDGKWYLYPSCGMAWVSEDFCTWTHVPMNLDDIGYAPTILAFRGKFYLTASDEVGKLYEADSPLGPWRRAGEIVGPDGAPLPRFADPMYFADDTGRVYLYWGCGGPGIYGVEMDSQQLNRALAAPQLLFGYNPDHVWERYGEYNENPAISYVEGPWMVKSGATYYLTYTAPGTSFRTYGMGAYLSESPLGPFRYAARNPFLSDGHGLVRGPGHGCIVRGPRNTLWAFYTCTVGYHHIFERRIGLDPAGFDDQGNLFVWGASETPQFAPGFVARPQDGNDAGLLPLGINVPVQASSEAPGRAASYANDHSMRTWWQPADDDRAPWIEVDLRTAFTVSALRLIWAEPNLDYDAGIVPGPIRYRVLAKPTPPAAWDILLDCSDNATDLLIDYRTFPAREVCAYRLEIVGWPTGLGVGVVDSTLFGVGHYPQQE